MLSSRSHLQSGIPSNAGPFSGPTKKLHEYLVTLLLTVTAYTHLGYSQGVMYISDGL